MFKNRITKVKEEAKSKISKNDGQGEKGRNCNLILARGHLIKISKN